MTEPTLKEKLDEIIEFVCEGDCEPCRYYTGKPIAEGSEFCSEINKSDQILSLLTEEVEKLTVIEKRVIPTPIYGDKIDITAHLQAQLSHTKDEILRRFK